MKMSKKITSSLCFSTALLLSACGSEENTEKQISEPMAIVLQEEVQQTSEAKPTLLERAKIAASAARKTDPTKSWDSVGKSSEEIWEKSKKTSQDILTLGTESSKEALQKSKEISQEIWVGSKEASAALWENGKGSSEEVWNESKETTKALWDNGKESSTELWNEGKETSTELWSEHAEKLESLFDDNENTSENDAFNKANEAFEADEI